MKPQFYIFVPFLALTLSAVAGNSDLEIHCVSKQVGEAVKKASDGGANRTQEHWAYEVTIENKTFKDLAGLEVRYAVFLTRETLGQKGAPAPDKQKGRFAIDLLKPHEKRTFTTDSVELRKSNLVGNWIYKSGAKPNAQDTLVGVSIHIYQNGQLFSDYSNPSNLSRENWD